jgi:transcriptional regulator with XRE-family HTH domain
MDSVRFGADVRLLRRRKDWTQARLAHESGVRRWVVTAIENGRGDTLPVDRLLPVVRALGATLTVRVQYQGEALDRLRDRRHARLVELVVGHLRDSGWLVATEVSFNVYGERGSIDILGFHPSTGALLVIEVKSVVPDIGGTLMTLDRKVRLAMDVARKQLGWQSRSVSRLLVLPEDRTARRRVTEHASTFDAAFPDRNVRVRRWLQAPAGTIRGLLFQTDAQDFDRARTSRARGRVG